ncbi:hypothetical protein KKG83_02830 [Candidatus Micrarchaeota archaeon]|nr:hypothetical protein [Candidatus Micrarchaeota archaeon]MBU2476380.1 hypothetical protein [Candidatus Micrarchaeota archaeon]
MKKPRIPKPVRKAASVLRARTGDFVYRAGIPILRKASLKKMRAVEIDTIDGIKKGFARETQNSTTLFNDNGNAVLWQKRLATKKNAKLIKTVFFQGIAGMHFPVIVNRLKYFLPVEFSSYLKPSLFEKVREVAGRDIKSGSPLAEELAQSKFQCVAERIYRKPEIGLNRSEALTKVEVFDPGSKKTVTVVFDKQGKIVDEWTAKLTTLI